MRRGIALLAPVAALALLSACGGTPRPAASAVPTAAPPAVEVATVLLPVRLAGPADHCPLEYRRSSRCGRSRRSAAPGVP